MKIAIAGYGLEGQTNYDYFRSLYPDVEMTVVDERNSLPSIPDRASLMLGPGALEQLHGFDMVVRTAGLAPRKIRTDGKMWSATNEFFAKCSAPIIGVTGTKGKGTTSSLIASILRRAGYTVHLVGNIGVPALSKLAHIESDDVVVYELSSFQLWDLERSPQVGVVLMIEPDHLDVHADMDEYVQAKSNIARHQGADSTLIYHPENSFAKEIAKNTPSKKVRYGVSADGGVYVHNDNFCVHGHRLCRVDSLKLVGEHNLENACAAMSAVLAFDSNVSHSAIIDGLADFDGLPHRLKLVREYEGVKYYDDSIATTPGSAIAAIRSFSEPKVVILGGSDKGADYTELVELCRDTGTRVVAIGQTGAKIQRLCEDVGVPCYCAVDITDAVKHAHEISEWGSVVILSPAAASFDMFTSYVDRGERFTEAVNNLGKR